MIDDRSTAVDCRFDPVTWDAGDPGRAQRWRATALAVASTVGLVLYFSWLLRPGRIGNPVLFGVLMTAELFNVVQALGFWWTCLGRRVRPRGQWPESIVTAAIGAEPLGEATPCDGAFVSSAELAERTKRDPDRSERANDPLNGLNVVDVDVFIPTYSEPADVVEATIAAATQMRGARVHVALLDDGNRDEMAELAQRHGIRYVRRTLHVGAKAGNINHALGRTRSPFVLVLDCDHVPHPDLLVRTLPEFVDEEVAYVQTPQYYANAPYNRIAEASWRQQALFFGPIARGKDSHGSMFCCGTNVIFRREALAGVGGFPTGSLTEDFALSVDLHERGWRSSYVPEVLASGLGPEDMASYVSQQHRWARGCLGMIPRVLRSTLPLRKKAQYLLSASYFLSGWTVLVYLSMPVVRILTGAQPLAGAAADSFLAAFGPYFVLSLATVASVGAGYYTFSAYSLATSTFWIHIDATYRVVARRTGSFVVTPKVGDSGRQFRPAMPTLVVIAVLVGAALYGLAHGRDAATLNNVAFAALHVSIFAHGIAAAVAPRWSATATVPVQERSVEAAAVDVA